MAGKVKKTAAAARKPPVKIRGNAGRPKTENVTLIEKEKAQAANDAKPAPKLNAEAAKRRENLHKMLMAKRQEVLDEIRGSIGQSLTEDQQRRLEAAMDIGDQALIDVQRELGISLLEMRNRKRQLIDEALVRVSDGTYGKCDECGVEISEKRLAAVPFAKLCVECQARQELLEKISKEEERD
jgi:DnaK suppressor protein